MNRIAEAVRGARRVALLPHVSPDADALGSCFALAAGLRRLGKQAEVVLEEARPPYLNFLAGEAQVFEGEAEPFDLCLCVDCADLKRLGKRVAMFSRADVTVCIDHHATNDGYADMNWIEPDAPASAQLCHTLLKALDVPLDSYIATCLYAALSADTGGFRYSNTTPDTLRLAAELVAAGIDHAAISKQLFDTDDFAAVRLKGMLGQAVELHCGGAVALCAATAEMFCACGVAPEDIDDIVSVPRRVRGALVAVALKETAQGVRVSLRSEGIADVGAVAARLGGGGHMRAAGASIDQPLEAAKGLVVTAMADELEKRGICVRCGGTHRDGH